MTLPSTLILPLLVLVFIGDSVICALAGVSAGMGLNERGTAQASGDGDGQAGTGPNLRGQALLGMSGDERGRGRASGDKWGKHE